jgi:hypothetical protein
MLTRRRSLVLSALSVFVACSDEVTVEKLSGKLVTQELVDFGDVQVGILMPFELEVKNEGTGLLTVSSIELAPTFVAANYEFKISEVAGFTLPPSSTRRIVVSFQPFADMETPIESSFIFHSDQENAPTFTVRLRGRGISSGLEVQPNPVDFGTVLIGANRTIDVTITNRLAVPVDVVSRLTDDGRPQIVNQGGLGRFEIISEIQPSGSLLPQGMMLQPQASITVQARYTPDSSNEGQEDRGKWTIANCANSLCDLPVVLIGKGTNAAISCDPASLDFGDVNPEATLTKSVRCTNVASETVIVTGWRLDTGGDREFSVEPYMGTPSSLAPGEEFTVEALFEPKLESVGRALEAALVISGRNPRALRDLTPTRVTITGRAGGPDIEVTPMQLNFGQIAIGTSSKRRVLIENVGYSDLTVTAINGDADGTRVFTVDRNAGVVPSGGSLVLEVDFTPVAEGAVSSRIIISSDDTDERELTVPLQGTGVDLPPCSYTVTPEMMNFGIVPVLRSTTQGLRIANIGNNDCLINDIEIVPGSSDGFSIVDGAGTGITLAPGAERTVIVQFVPPREGAEMGTLSFYISNPMRSNPEIALRGTGSASALLITPNELNFGRIRVDCSTRDRPITIYNTGSTATRITNIELPMGVSTEFELSSLPAGLPVPPGMGAVIRPGESVELSVRYHARDIGQDTGYFHIYESGRTDPYVIPLYGEGATDATNEDRFEQLETPEVDILFVIDNSCSMSEEQAALTGNFSSFIQFADAQALDYRIAVVTTDVEGEVFGGTACPASLTAMRPRGLPQGACGYFADGNESTSNPDWRLITPDEQPSPEAAFVAIASQGIDGSGTEQGLQAAYQALSAPLITGWNSGFLRPDAYFALIFLSDEEDQSSGSIDFFVNFYKAIKGFRNTNLFSASAIVGDTPGGCSSADAGSRYVAVAQQTGGIFESICTQDWATALQNLGLSVFGYKSRFFLSNQPVPGTLTIEVDGVPVQPRAPSGQVRWTYDQGTNSINFAPLAIPEPGSEIVIRYQAECL